VNVVTFFFLSVFVFVVLQRLLELAIARRNARHIRSLGGFEVGGEHYRYIVGLHVLFLLSLLCEAGWKGQELSPWWWVPFSLFIAAQVLRYWCIYSLGRRWNTRIFVLPGTPPVSRGPYRYLRHPNYLVVMTEFVSLPATFSAYTTAVLFSLLNFWLLWRVRIPLEEAAIHYPRK
jgi:methyltransferase